MNEWTRQERNERRLFIIKILLFVVIAIIIVAALTLGYKYTCGVTEANINHEIYKNNTSYIEGQIKDLADYKKEYDDYIRAEDEEAAKAVIQYIKDDFSNFSSKKIENKNIRAFLEDVFKGLYD